MEITEDDTPAIELAAETMVEMPDIETLKEATEETHREVNQAVETSAGNVENTDEAIEETLITAEAATEKESELSGKETERPAPEDIPDSQENDENVHLGAEASPSVDTELHKTHQSIH